MSIDTEKTDRVVHIRATVGDHTEIEGGTCKAPGQTFFGARTFWIIFVVLTMVTVLTAQVRYYSVPTIEAIPTEITAGPDGALWFSEYHGKKIGRISTTGTITEYLLPSATWPRGIAVGSDEALWYVSYGDFWIGRITTAGVVTEYRLSSRGNGGIAAGPDGAIWFTEHSKIGRITTDGVITEYNLPAEFPQAWEITAGPDGAMWFTPGIYFPDRASGKIGKITTTGIITVYSLPASSCEPVGITSGPDGAIWFTTFGDYSCPVVRFSTDEKISKFGSGAGFSITTAPDGELWFTGYGYKIGRLTADHAFEVLIPRDDPGMAYSGTGIAVGPDGNLWFTEPVTNRIGQVIRVANRTRTTTIATSSLNPSVVGEAVTFTATVTSSERIPPDGETITFYNGIGVLGTAPLNGGRAMLTISTLPVGVFTITARYAGNPTFAASTSPSLQQTVIARNKSATATALSSTLNPSIYGQKVTFMAQVSTSGPVQPTGTVAFMWRYFTQTYTIGTATLNSAGVAALTKSNLNAYPYPLTAVYRGDANNAPSTSPALNQAVLQTASAVAITSSGNPSTVGQAVTFTAKITSATVIPSGPVTFKAGTMVLGTAQLSGGKAALTTSSLPAGSTVIKVTYSGNSNIKGSSASITQTVQR